MISAEVFMIIIAMNKIQGFSIRKIAQMTGKHRNTVKRYLDGNEFSRYRRQKRETKLSAYRQVIDDFLSADAYQFDKEGHDNKKTAPTPFSPPQEEEKREMRLDVRCRLGGHL